MFIGHTHLRALRWNRRTSLLALSLEISWALRRLAIVSMDLLLQYAFKVFVPTFRATSVIGFSLLCSILLQLWSGLLLALSYLPDPSFVIPTRSDLFVETWWYSQIHAIHILGVDLIFVLSYLHILKKIYLRNYAEGDPDGWFTGAHAFLIFHLVVFLGITLSANHLGDVTVTIAANMFWSLSGSWHRAYSAIFGNRHLSTDQLERYALAHYISAWYYIFLVQTHVIFVHEMWDADANQSTQQSAQTPKSSWIWDALKKEFFTMFALYKILVLSFLLLAHPDTRVINYGFFEQWGESEYEEINFYIVSPHWYFRAHMGLLTVSARHYEGLSWLIAFYVCLCTLPIISRIWSPVRAGGMPIFNKRSWNQELAYVCFWGSLAFIAAALPCGRFYYDVSEGYFGQSLLRVSYEYLYAYFLIIPHLIARLELLTFSQLINLRSYLLYLRSRLPFSRTISFGYRSRQSFFRILK